MVENWDRFEEDDLERIVEEVFAIFRRMLEPPPAEEMLPHHEGERE
jgi:hypothetical protein